MAAKYSIKNLIDGTEELIDQATLLKRFAPHLDASDKKKVTEFLTVILHESVMQEALAVEIEELEPEELLEKAKAIYEAAKSEAVAAKNAIDEVVRSILADVTVEEIKKGAIHKVSNADNAKSYGIVEYWVASGNASLTYLLQGEYEELPEHVVAELQAIQANRKKPKK